MKKNLTELVFVLDRSGSMHGLEGDVTGGFNRVLNEHKKEDGECLVSTVLFNDAREVLHDRQAIGDVAELSAADFRVGGNTALLDAVGFAIHHIGSIHKYAREEDVPEKTIFVIMTDGCENASRAYGPDEVRAMIHREQEQYGWEFLFLGANIDAAAAARQIGVREDRAARFRADSEGVDMMFSAVCEATVAMRGSRDVDGSWKRNLPEQG